MFKPKDPPWLSKACKDLYYKYKRKYKSFARRGFPQQEKFQIDELKVEYSTLVQKQKDKYMQSLGSAVSNPNTCNKKYWTTLKRLINNKVATIIPPILQDNLFITDIKEKCDAFNKYLKKQCTLLRTSSTLPLLAKSTELTLNNVKFSRTDITTIIAKLNIDKAHGHDGLSTRILKMFGDTISNPLYLIYTNCISKGYFPKKWKKANVVPIYKKINKYYNKLQACILITHLW